MSYKVDVSPIPEYTLGTDILAAEETLALAKADEKPKGVKTGNNYHINLKVVGDGSVVQFKTRHKPCSKLMKPYYTPAQLEMEDENTIDAFRQQQTGGSYQKENLLRYSRTLFLQTKKTFLIRKPQFCFTTS
ncbi:LOW QUALITY PROTEIN: small ubiquitin-related modifier 2-like [Glossophaga mutica]